MRMSAYEAPKAAARASATSATSARRSSAEASCGKISAHAGTVVVASSALPAAMNSRRDTGGSGIGRDYIDTRLRSNWHPD